MDDDEFGFTDYPEQPYAGGGDEIGDSVGSGSYQISNLGNLAGQFLPISSGGYRAGVTPAMGSFGAVAGAAGAAVLTLGGRLAGMFGRGAGTAVINGVKFNMSRLWPYIRQYGPGAVATALGITVAELGALAMNAPQHAKKRRRGISARDISTTRRVVGFTNKMARQIGCVSRPRARYRPRRRYAY